MDDNKTALDAFSREELVEVARKLKPLQKKLDTLVDKYKEVVKEGTTRKKDIESLQEQKKQLEIDLQTQKQERDTFVQSLQSEHENKVLSLQKQLQDQQKEYEERLSFLQKQLEATEKRQGSVVQLQDEKTAIEEREHEQAPPSKPPDTVSNFPSEADTTTTTTTTTAAATTTTTTNAELETQLSIINELKAKNNTLLDSVRDAHDNKTLAQDREQEAKRSLEKLKKEMKILEDKLKQTTTIAQKEKTELETRIVELTNKLESENNSYEMQKSNANLIQKQTEQARLTALELCEQLKATCVEKDNKYNASVLEISELRNKLTQVEKRQAKSLSLEQEVVELRTKCEAFQASLEQEKIDRAKERTRHQQELEIEREERVRERGTQEQAREKMAHLRYEETEKAHAKWQEAHVRATKGDEKVSQLSQTVAELTSAIEKKTKELLDAQGEGGAAKQREQTLTQEHEQEMKASETKHNDKYQRLLREFKAYRERTTKLLDEQATKLQQNSELISKLEEEISTGKPGERRMFELAELQARRDVHIQQQEAQLAELRTVLDSHNAVVKQLEEDKRMLSEQCKQLQTSRSRGEVNLDYLKNVILRFFCAAEGSAERKTLIPAIGKILQFTPEETACLNQGSSSTWWNMFVPAVPTPKVSMWVGQDLTGTPSSSFTTNTPPPTPPPRRGSAGNVPGTPSNSSATFSAAKN